MIPIWWWRPTRARRTFSDIANEFDRTRLLARRCLRLGRLGRLRPQEDGHHRAGAWECVKRHFREMDIDIQRQPFRVVGVGDMSGDVFGNGMLLSPEIRLVAASITATSSSIPIRCRGRACRAPAPVRPAAFELAGLRQGEDLQGRRRLPRASKSVALSPEVQAVLGFGVRALTPAELIRAILKCETDLLWFGGIGTYVRASSETEADAGDRANDTLRVTGAELRAKVVGEGANLGMTQARPHRVRRARRPPQHRLHRQFGRREHLRPGGQHQDRAGAGGALGQADDDRPQHPADRDDRRRGGGLAAQQLPAVSALSLAERRSLRDLPDYRC
jgi:glutamate dehydrogenase